MSIWTLFPLGIKQKKSVNTFINENVNLNPTNCLCILCKYYTVHIRVIWSMICNRPETCWYNFQHPAIFPSSTSIFSCFYSFQSIVLTTFIYVRDLDILTLKCLMLHYGTSNARKSVSSRIGQAWKHVGTRACKHLKHTI